MRWTVALGVVAAGCGGAQAQGAQVSAAGSDPHAKQLIEAAVKSELAASAVDHSTWMYRDHDRTPDRDAVYELIDTPQGSLRRMVELDGRPVDATAREKEAEHMNAFVDDKDAQAKAKKAGEHDDAQATRMLKMLPNAFLWRVQSEDAEQATLTFEPLPDFKAPDMEARVMSLMAGELVVAKPDYRIRTLRGKLTDDVRIGFGILGKLRKGGTFDVERREIAPHIWQITETRVHIDGRALLFKSIGQQEDEVKTNWKPSTVPTLDAAARKLGAR